MRIIAIACVVIAVVMFIASVAIFMTGIDVAILTMIIAFGFLTFGTGAAAAARRN